MARQWRIEYPGALYHILSRGNGCQDIFVSDEDRLLFLELIEDFSERFGIEVYAYVLMDNHYHLLIKTVDANLSKAMQWFGTAYTRRFNIQNVKSGHLFQGRFKSIIVENDAYLLRLSCYIHRNPLRAGMVKRLAEYKWSSYPYYAYKKETPVWLKTKLLLGQVAGKDKKKAYRRKVQQYSDETGSIWEDVKHGLFYGSKGFLDELKSRFPSQNKSLDLPQYNRLFKDVDPQEILQRGVEILQINPSKLSSRRMSDNDRFHRDLLIYLLWASGRFNNKQIGSLFGITYSNVSRRANEFKRKLTCDNTLKEKCNSIKAQIKL